MVWRGNLLSINGIDGTALTLLAREAIGLLLAAEEQGARLFSYGVQSDLTLSADGEIADKKQLRAAFMARHSGSHNAFLPILLENGLKAARIGLTAQESQYIESRKFQIEEIARIWRVPEVLLGNSTSGKSSTYASAEQFFMSYTKHTWSPWATRIEQTMNRDLLTQKEQPKYFFRHDFSSLLRGDTAARFASYNTAINAGFMMPEEARRYEGWSYVPGLDYFVRNMANAKEGPGAGGGGESDNKSTPTDENAEGPRRRIAAHIFQKEHKALVGRKENADTFYSHFGGFVEDLTGADLDSVLAYVEMRRTTADRFSTESQDKAINTLISICK